MCVHVGVLTSLSDTGHQWDAPNAWPPLQHMLIEGLSRCGVAEGQRLAQDIASRWLRSAWEGYKTTGHMHEKYNAREPGVCGGGGEYTPQVGDGPIHTHTHTHAHTHTHCTRAHINTNFVGQTHKVARPQKCHWLRATRISRYQDFNHTYTRPMMLCRLALAGPMGLC